MVLPGGSWGGSLRGLLRGFALMISHVVLGIISHVLLGIISPVVYGILSLPWPAVSTIKWAYRPCSVERRVPCSLRSYGILYPTTVRYRRLPHRPPTAYHPGTSRYRPSSPLPSQRSTPVSSIPNRHPSTHPPNPPSASHSPQLQVRSTARKAHSHIHPHTHTHTHPHIHTPTHSLTHSTLRPPAAIPPTAQCVHDLPRSRLLQSARRAGAALTTAHLLRHRPRRPPSGCSCQRSARAADREHGVEECGQAWAGRGLLKLRLHRPNASALRGARTGFSLRSCVACTVP